MNRKSNKAKALDNHHTLQLSDFNLLLMPQRLWTREEILARQDCPVPREPGLYAWYFRRAPATVPIEQCHHHDGMVLLYVGISPKRPPENGARPSRQSLWNRVRYHMRGNAYGSTLRLTLGCLLADELGIHLRRVGSGDRLTFADGEQVLSAWMNDNACVTWMAHPQPWNAERFLIGHLNLPLNLEHNGANTFHSMLSESRRRCRENARAREIWRAQTVA